MANKLITFTVVIAVTAFAVHYLRGYLTTDNTEFDEGILRGKNIIVTGASSGIGEQAAYWYARLGANVFITARRENLLKKVLSKCQKLGLSSSRFGYVSADMAIKSGRERVIQEAHAIFDGEIDQLLLNHGLLSRYVKWEGTKEQLDFLELVTNVNFLSFVHLTALALPSLTKSSGSIGVVGSDSGRRHFPYGLDYGSSKFALDGFFSGLRHEFKANSRNVSVTYGIIGLIHTDAADEALEGFFRHMKQPEQFRPAPQDVPSADEAAYAIISATTRRLPELYYPACQWIRYETIMRAIFPTKLEESDIF